MDVFISWSGLRSGAAAEALRDWLPKVINALRPWLSSADIDKGARWGLDIASRLSSSKAGIICLTPENLRSEWILFEAGALSKTIQNTDVCPLLFNLERAEITGPLAQFQSTKAEKGDVLKLVKTLNIALGDDALSNDHIESMFEILWPSLESQFKSLPTEEKNERLLRPDREVLEEILGFVRNQNRLNVSLLAEDDQKQLLTLRAWKAARSIHGPVGGGTGVTIVNGKFELKLTMNKNGNQIKYTIFVPLNASPDEMEAAALAQIQIADEMSKAQSATLTLSPNP
jgi:hypothetical protein